MLSNMPSDYSVLNALSNSEYHFHLTGSRFFGTEKSDSDWDFFAEDSGDIRIFLQNIGFEIEIEGAYVDDPNNACVVKMANVHVQLVEDLKAKQTIQEIFKKLGIFHVTAFKEKKIQRYLWKIALWTYKANLPLQVLGDTKEGIMIPTRDLQTVLKAWNNTILLTVGGNSNRVIPLTNELREIFNRWEAS